MLTTFENTINLDKKVLTILLFIVIVFVILLALVGNLIRIVMNYQAKRVDDYMGNVVKASVVNDIKSFRKFSRKKNSRLLYKQSLIPFAIITAGVLLWVVVCWATGDWGQNIFQNSRDILFRWDFDNEENYAYFFGIKLLSKFPSLINEPHIVKEHITAYIEVTLIMTGVVWYLYSCQCFLARSVYSFFASRDLYRTSLKDIKKAKDAAQMASMPTPPTKPAD